jgi:CubicO group peptidase (beta-lactamase class C family)
MKTRRRVIMAATLALLVGWTTIFLAGSVGGWWRRSLAPHGDTSAFLAAAGRLIDQQERGNVAFALLQDGAIVGERYASVGRAVGRDTLFQVASVSKWITAIGVMTLVDAGKVDLDAPVETYLKRWKLPPSPFDHRDVTIRRLLSHTAGLTDGLGYGGFAPGEPVQSLIESLTKAADAAPGRDGAVKVGMRPGSQWQYSGGGYTLLQLMIEDVTGEPFAAYMQRAVLEPLGMTRSTFVMPADDQELAEIFDEDGRQTPYRQYAATGAASLFTCIEDLARLVQAQRSGPEKDLPRRGVLRAQTIEEMYRPHGRQYGVDIWGLGVFLYASNNAGGQIVGHDGGNYPTINTTVRFDPSSGDGIVVLATGDPPMSDRLGGEWVFWRTGNVDKMTVMQEAQQTLTTLIVGWLFILAAGAVLAWRARRTGSGRSTPRVLASGRSEARADRAQDSVSS